MDDGEVAFTREREAHAMSGTRVGVWRRTGDLVGHRPGTTQANVWAAGSRMSARDERVAGRTWSWHRPAAVRASPTKDLRLCAGRPLWMHALLVIAQDGDHCSAAFAGVGAGPLASSLPPRAVLTPDALAPEEIVLLQVSSPKSIAQTHADIRNAQLVAGSNVSQSNEPHLAVSEALSANIRPAVVIEKRGLLQPGCGDALTRWGPPSKRVTVPSG